MRILILTQYYPPETGAPQNRLSDLAERLTTLGHQLTILTAMPNYPRGEILREYRGRFMAEEGSCNLRIIRTWIYATNSKGIVRRLLNYFSFVLTSLLVGMWKLDRHDVVMIESPPLFLGISGFLLSCHQKAKFVFNVSDLWPDSAAAMGIVRNKYFIALSKRLEEFLYRHANLITGQTQGIVNNISTRFPDKQVALVTNGVNVSAFCVASTPDQKIGIRAELGFGDKFVIGYAGLHGLAQGLETVLHAARIVTKYEDWLFAFFGDGPEKEKLRRLASELKLNNLRFYPPQPMTRMPTVLGSFDVALIPLKNLELFKGALPSKMFEAMAAAVPVIVTNNGEAKELVERAGAGLCVSAEDPGAMADAILQLYKDEEYRRALGLNGQRYVVEHYDRQKIARQFEQLLTDRFGLASESKPHRAIGSGFGGS